MDGRTVLPVPTTNGGLPGLAPLPPLTWGENGLPRGHMPHVYIRTAQSVF